MAKLDKNLSPSWGRSNLWSGGGPSTFKHSAWPKLSANNKTIRVFQMGGPHQRNGLGLIFRSVEMGDSHQHRGVAFFFLKKKFVCFFSDLNPNLKSKQVNLKAPKTTKLSRRTSPRHVGRELPWNGRTGVRKGITSTFFFSCFPSQRVSLSHEARWPFPISWV